MPRSFFACTLALLVALAPGRALAYTSSQTASGTTDGAARTFTFSSLPQSSSTVTVEVFLRGDFNASSEYAEITVDGVYQGSASPSATYNGDTNCRQGTTTYTVPASYVADGSLTVLVAASSAVDWSPCEPWTYTVTVTYDDNSPPTVSNTADLSTAEDTPTSVGFTVGDAETAVDSLVVTATSSDQAVIADAGLVLSGTTASRTLGIAPVPDASGSATITVTVTDAGGLSVSDTFVATVTPVNDPPLADAAGPYSGDEGAPVSMDASGSGDPDGVVTGWAWDCDDDGTYETVAPTPTGGACTFPDDGTYTVGLQVTDDGGLASGNAASATVTVGNVAPIITSTPGSAAPEGALWTYAPTVSDPGSETFAWTLSASAPAGMTIDAVTGVIEWTPTYADALVGTAATVLTVDDGDGGSDLQTISLVVDVQDDDVDGLADSWETANGLDPTDPSDATGDPDLDGMTNLDEYAAGTDPNAYDGPDAPLLSEPIAGDEVATESPDLYWSNANDPQGEALTYTVEVYEDAALTTLLTSEAGVVEDGSGTSTWKVDVQLAENAEVFWRARAADAWVEGPWSSAESFVVNALNEPPAAPVLTAPIGGETAATLTPTLSWSEATDVDGDALTYEVEVWDQDGGVVASTSGVSGDGLVGAWTVEVALAEDAVYRWTARAVDDEGLAGDWADEEPFLVSADDGAPSDVVFLEPADGAVLATLSPVLVVSASTDPEGGDVRYRFEIDTAASFDSPDYAEATVDEPAWDLGAEGETLRENATIYARVRALDEADIASQPDTISFFVAGENDPPEVPTLLAPADGTEGDGSPRLEVADPADPEGDVVFVDFVVARDAEMTDVVATREVVVGGEGSTTWTVDATLEGTVYWSARARDELGATSEFAVPFVYEAPTESSAPSDDGTVDGCDCQSRVGGGAGSTVWLLALVPAVLRRRRR